MQGSITGYLIALGTCLIITTIYIVFKKDVNTEKVKSFIDNYYLALFSITTILFLVLTVIHSKLVDKVSIKI
jgi:hypothetical protein